MLPNDTEPTNSTSTSIRYIAKPNSEFYSIFSHQEILDIIHALEFNREIPLKYSYKGRGAKIWDDFYLKYIIPKWYRTYNVEIVLLNQAFKYIVNAFEDNYKFNIVDVGAGNSFPAKKFIYKLNKLGKANKYIALDISEDLLKISQKNITKWFPSLDFQSSIIDIEKYLVSPELLKNQKNNTFDSIGNIFLHLGVTIGNHQNREQVFQNFRDSMGKHDLLIFTNEIGDNSKFTGGCYHAEQICKWIQTNLRIPASDCELIRKYDAITDSIVASMKLRQNYTINFQCMEKEIDQNVIFFADEEITLWRFHKHTISNITQELEQAGLKLLHYLTDKKSSHIMVICSVKERK
jgi:uncharacterized SAM-dependent methyltransferase